jgi:hypothetical protein
MAFDIFFKRKGGQKGPSQGLVTGWSYAKRVLRDTVLLGLVVFLVSWAISFKFTGRSIPKDVFSKHWPTFSESQAAGGPHRDFMVLFVFAPWCQVCHLNTGLFDDVKSPFYQVQGVAMSFDDPKEVNQFVQETGFKPQVVLSDLQLDRALGINQYPTFLVVSPNGEVLTGWTGYTTSLGFWLRIQAIRFFASHMLN